MKKSFNKKLKLNKTVISKFDLSEVKAGSRRGCVGTNNCGPTSGTENCGATQTGTAAAGCNNTIGCPIN